MSLKVLTLLVLVGLTLALPRNKREAKVIPQIAVLQSKKIYASKITCKWVQRH
jgi:hypothetical protein